MPRPWGNIRKSLISSGETPEFAGGIVYGREGRGASPRGIGLVCSDDAAMDERVRSATGFLLLDESRKPPV
jgi:hypothetical protein